MLSLDLSWDFVTNDILDNIHDQLKRHNIAPALQQGLQNALKNYKAFTVLGGWADKADDLKLPNLASYYRTGAEIFAQAYFASLSDFKAKVRTAFRDDATRAVFATLFARHGDQGNNWLYIMRRHQNRLMFGTDALSPGIKAHGDAAYAMNARVMYPIFDILEEAERYEFPGTTGMSERIARTNYENIFHDPEIEARRQAWEHYLTTENATSSSSQTTPH